PRLSPAGLGGRTTGGSHHFCRLASDRGAPAPRRPAARTTRSITGSPRPSHDRRLASFFVGSPRTVGPQPHDVLRLALPAPSQARPGGARPAASPPCFGSPRPAGPPPPACP